MAIAIKPSKGIVGFLFGAVFFISGLVTAYFSVGKMSIDYLASEDWQQVPVEITSLELESHSGENTTYSISATYRYHYNDTDYQNDRVSLSDVSDNIGNYWQDLYKRLDSQRSQNRVLAWVDPSEPQTAVLDRTFRVEMLLFAMVFVVMFSGSGGFFMWWSLRPKKNIDLNLLKTQGIISNEKTGFKVLFWFGLVFFCVGSLFSLLALPDAIDSQQYWALAILIFVIIGLVLMGFARKSRANYKKIGPTPLYLDPLPGAVGGQIGGYFDIASRLKENRLKITTSCLETVRSGKRTSTRIRWQESTQAYCKETSSGVRASFVVDCPTGFPASTVNNIRWQAEANGWLFINSQAQEFSRSWEIPVSDDAEILQSKLNIPESHLIEEAAKSKQFAEESALIQIPINQQGHILDVLSAAGRAVGTTFIGSLIGIIFAAAGIFTIIENWWPGYFFVATGVVLFALSVFTIGRKIETRIDTQQRLLTVKRSWFSIPLYHREVLLSDPSQFSIKETSSSQAGTKMTKYFALYADNNGKKIKFAEGVEGKTVADALLDKITQQVFP